MARGDRVHKSNFNTSKVGFNNSKVTVDNFPSVNPPLGLILNEVTCAAVCWTTAEVRRL